MTFAEKVRYVRAKLLLSQQALAKAIGVSFQTVNRWENGHGKPNLVIETKFNNFCNENDIVFQEENK